MSRTEPTLLMGWRCALASRYASLLSKPEAKGISVIEEVIQYAFILGANSAAMARASPSPAPFEAESRL